MAIPQRFVITTRGRESARDIKGRCDSRLIYNAKDSLLYLRDYKLTYKWAVEMVS